MIRKRCKSTHHPQVRQAAVICIVLSIFSLAAAASGWGDAVDVETARTVAQNKVRQHLELYGAWNGTTTPTVGAMQSIDQDGVTVAYNFNVNPSGHILVAVDDAFSPVLLYSTRFSFDPGRKFDPDSIESWIIPELYHNTRTLDKQRAAAGGSLRMLSATDAQKKISSAWQFLTTGRTADHAAAGLAERQRDLTRRTTVGPLLTTTWSQGSPFNLKTPADTTCDHTLTGCVATAWSQLMRYWSWPTQGLTSKAYTWNGQTLSVDFSAATYDWANMPDVLDDTSTQAQKDAVALLMYHVGVAAEMDFGCTGSGSSAWADDALDTYFNYKANMTWLARTEYNDSEWFALFKDEFDADPPRPVILSIFETTGGGHEVVADGYQNDGTNLIHLNMGWEGSQDAFYNITSDFNAGGYTWEADSQYIVTHISPNDDPPSVDAGSDQSVTEGSGVTLAGSVADLGGADVSSYAWSQTSGAGVTLSGSTTANATFTAPNVASDTTLVFNFRAQLSNGAFASDTVSITVENTTDGSATSPFINQDSGGGGSSSGGCFMTNLF